MFAETTEIIQVWASSHWCVNTKELTFHKDQSIENAEKNSAVCLGEFSDPQRIWKVWAISICDRNDSNFFAEWKKQPYMQRIHSFQICTLGLLNFNHQACSHMMKIQLATCIIQQLFIMPVCMKKSITLLWFSFIFLYSSSEQILASLYIIMRVEREVVFFVVEFIFDSNDEVQLMTSIQVLINAGTWSLHHSASPQNHMHFPKAATIQLSSAIWQGCMLLFPLGHRIERLMLIAVGGKCREMTTAPRVLNHGKNTGNWE